MPRRATVRGAVEVAVPSHQEPAIGGSGEGEALRGTPERVVPRELPPRPAGVGAGQEVGAEVTAGAGPLAMVDEVPALPGTGDAGKDCPVVRLWDGHGAPRPTAVSRRQQATVARHRPAPSRRDEREGRGGRTGARICRAGAWRR